MFSGLCLNPEELKHLQEEFIRLDTNNNGVLSKEDIRRISETEFGKKYASKNALDWDHIINECDVDGDG